MKRNEIANTATVETTVATSTTTERKSAERSTSMKRNTSTKAAKAAAQPKAEKSTATTATKSAKRIPVDVIDRGWSFTTSAVRLNGHEFAASKFDVAKNGDVYVLATVEGAGIRLHFGKGSAAYHEALEAAVAAKAAQPKAEKPAETEPVAQPKAEKPAKAKATKAAAQPKAEKPAKAKAAKPAPQPKAAIPADDAWIGTTITGKGWTIAFDEATQRTKVAFEGTPSAKQKAAIDAAGFYWSNTTKSWNKKLTRKAYRAALALAETLNAIK